MWTYVQKTGELFDAALHRVGCGYAGHDEGKNNPALQNVAGMGPLPCGMYTLLPPRDSDHVGRYAIPLLPDPANEMYGREGFYLHGDSLGAPGTASHGCVVQAHAVRVLAWNSGDHRLKVISGEAGDTVTGASAVGGASA